MQREAFRLSPPEIEGNERRNVCRPTGIEPLLGEVPVSPARDRFVILQAFSPHGSRPIPSLTGRSRPLR